MQAANAEEILVPMITWSLDGQRVNADAGDVQQSLKAIRDYSVFQVLLTTADCHVQCSTVHGQSRNWGLPSGAKAHVNISGWFL